MTKEREQEVLEEFLELENKQLALVVINYYKDVKGIKNDMVGSLNLLDQVAEESSDKKELLRKTILDNFNELPRTTLEFLEELLQILKE